MIKLQKVLFILFLNVFCFGSLLSIAGYDNSVFAVDNGTMTVTFNPSGGTLTSDTAGAGSLKLFPAVTVTATFDQAAVGSGNLAINSCWRLVSDNNNLKIKSQTITSAALGLGFVNPSPCSTPSQCGTDVRFCYDSNGFNIPSAQSVVLGTVQLQQASLGSAVPGSVTFQNTRSAFKDGEMSPAQPNYTLATVDTSASFTLPATWPSSKNVGESFTYHWQVVNSVTGSDYISRYKIGNGSENPVGDVLPGSTGTTIGRDETITFTSGGSYTFYIYKVGSTTALASKTLQVNDPNVSLSFSPGAGSVSLSGNKNDPYFTATLNFNSGSNLVTNFNICLKWDTTNLEYGCPSAVITANSAYATVNPGYGYVCWSQSSGFPKVIPSAQLGTVQFHLKSSATNAGWIKFDSNATVINFDTGRWFPPTGYGNQVDYTFDTRPLPPGTHPNCGATATTTPTGTGTPTNTGTPTPTGPTSTPPQDCPRGDFGNLGCEANGEINGTDLDLLLTAWGSPVPTPVPGKHSADIAPSSPDGTVNSLDLDKLLANWGLGSGSTGTPTPTPTDAASAYPRAPAMNYQYYAWDNANINQLHPSGAPWGKIYPVIWNRIQGGLDPNTINFQGIDSYLATAATQGNPVVIMLNTYEWTRDNRSGIPNHRRVCEDGTEAWGLGSDLTPDFIRNADEWVTAYPKMANGTACLPVPMPETFTGTCSMVEVPQWGGGTMVRAVKVLAGAFGTKYNNDPRVAGFILGFGADNEYGSITGNWGDCPVRGAVMAAGFNNGAYREFMTKPGPNNDVGDWFGAAIPNKPIYIKVTGQGKDMVPQSMPDWPTNVGLLQASLTPDHNWFQQRDTNSGIMDIAVQASTHRPVAWENAFPGWASNGRQEAYRLFLAMLHTFPDFFDFTSGCFDAGILPTCNWAKQYYGKLPQNTNEVWIAFQESEWPTWTGGGSFWASGWQRDWEYGLKLESAKGVTLKKPTLVTDFSQAVANEYSGQARKMVRNQTVILHPVVAWKGLSTGSAYDVTLTYIGTGAHVKVEIGSDASGWETKEFDSESDDQWHQKTLNFTSGKRPVKVKITPNDNLYAHMVSVKIK